MPACAVAALTAAMAKWLWRDELRAVRWWRLALTGSLAGTLSLIVGVVITGHDGRLGTYLGLVVMVAVAEATHAFNWLARFRR